MLGHHQHMNSIGLPLEFLLSVAIAVSHVFKKQHQSDQKDEPLYLFPCTLQNRIGLGNDIQMCRIRIKSKHSIKTVIRDLRFPHIAYRKSPNHATISVSSILTFNVSEDPSPLSDQCLDIYSGNGVSVKRSYHPSTLSQRPIGNIKIFQMKLLCS